MTPFSLPGMEYSVEASGRVPKQVLCEQCGKEYVYLLEASVTGTAFSTLFLQNTTAQQEAEAKAREKLERELATSCDVVPCPACCHYQKDMVAYARRTRLKWMLGCGILLLWLAFGVTISAAMAREAERHGTTTTFILSASQLLAIVAALGVSGIGLLVGRYFQCRGYDPNNAPLTIRKDVARRRAMTREQFENMVRNQQRRKP